MVTVDVDLNLNNNILIIGAGEAGGRIAQEFYFNGFKKVIALNTAKTDLDGLELDDENKLVIPIGTGGGAGKDPNMVRNAIDDFYDDVLRFIRSNAGGVQSVMVCVGGGGGTGGGLGIVVAQIVAELGLPVGIIYTLPLMNESTLVFVNALDNLKEIHQNAQDASISPLIVVDNNKLVQKFKPTAANFWGPLNGAIVTVVKKFNEYSQKPTKFISGLDTQDLKRLMTTGGVCAIGHFDVNEESSQEQLAEEVIKHFFMDGFDLATASASGVIVVGSEKTLGTTGSAEHISGIFDKISERLDGGMFFRGVYSDENVKYLRVYVLFNGLALPSEHINDMMKQVRAGYNKMKTQQNRLDDGIHVDFGSGVGGLFNNQQGGKTIQRKKGMPTNNIGFDESPMININTDAPRREKPKTPPVPIDNNPQSRPGMKRGER